MVSIRMERKETEEEHVVAVIYSITSSISVYNYTGQDISQNSVGFRIVRYFIVKLAVPILTQNMRNLFMHFLLAGMCYSLQTGPLVQI